MGKRVLKRTVAIALKRGCASRTNNRQVEVSVSIEICCSYRNGRKPSGIIYMRCKRTIAIPQKDGNSVVGLIGNGDIRLAIVVEITGDERARALADRQIYVRLKRTVAIAE